MQSHQHRPTPQQTTPGSKPSSSTSLPALPARLHHVSSTVQRLIHIKCCLANLKPLFLGKSLACISVNTNMSMTNLIHGIRFGTTNFCGIIAIKHCSLHGIQVYTPIVCGKSLACLSFNATMSMKKLIHGVRFGTTKNCQFIDIQHCSTTWHPICYR